MNAQTAPFQPPRSAVKPSFHRPELDILRFAAFLMVFVHHDLLSTYTNRLALWNSQWFQLIRFPTAYGLSLFFVLSSYLITEIVLREREFTGTIHLKAFYIRRVLRIWPLYAIFLAFSYVLGRFVTVLFVPGSFVLQYVFLLGNHAFYHNINGNPMGPLWSISVEEQFYLCWPFVALVWGRRGLLWFSLFILAAGVAFASWLTAHAVMPGFAIWTNSITQFGCFAAGALLALALHGRSWKPTGLQRLGLLFFGLSSWAISDGVYHFKRTEVVADRQQLPHVLGFELILVGCCLLFLSLLSLPMGRWARPFIYLGRISYGLYVFHVLALFAATELARQLASHWVINHNRVSLLIMIVALLLTCLCAVISYEFYEKRFLRLKSRFAYVRT